MNENFALRTILTTTTLVVLEAGVWTEVGYLPHWLFVTTMFLAVAAFIFLNAEALLRRYIHRGYRLLTTIVYVSFVGSLLFAVVYGSEYGAKPFHSEVRIDVNSSPIKRGLTMFVAACGGAAISPISFLVNIQVANLQNGSANIEEYSVAVSRHRFLPWAWYPLPIIPLSDCSLYILGSFGPPHSFNPQVSVKFPKGTYLLATPMPQQVLSSAMMLQPDHILDVELIRSIPAHETVRGWIALGPAANYKVFSGQKLFFRVTVRDSSGEYTTTTEQTPVCCAQVKDTGTAVFQPTGIIQDLSEFKVKPFGN